MPIEYLTKIKHFYCLKNFDNDQALESLIIKLHDQFRFNRLITLSENDVVRTAKLRSLLKIDGQDFFSGWLFKDKPTMKEFAQLRGLNVPGFTSISSFQEAVEFAENHGYPLICKPINEAGSLDVLYIKDNTDLGEVKGLLKKYDQIDIEEFIKGRLFHVDGVISKRKIAFVSVSMYLTNDGKSTTLFNQQSDSLDVTRTFSDFTINQNSEEFKNLASETNKLLEDPTFDNGTVHIEYIIDTNGKAYFIEMGSRTGGMMIANTIEHKFGFVMNEASFKLQANIPFNFPDKKIDSEYGYMTILPENNKLIKFNEEIIRENPDVIQLESNAVIGHDYQLATESTSRIGTILFSAKNVADVKNKINNLTQLIDKNIVWST
ncbi:ATP-grasp domain-containing protein [Agrilactobacillus composti]|nr:ATP-grasp domain-containing protein [Agrilactobacillus composti]